ncbi:isoleucine--tRNA ligase, partial [Patescibacteria group bacterium]|nr:isoleucine--tRNA ligase [Patescibacteria group bacterium]
MSIDFPKIEKEILKFWKENKIFEKTLKKTKGGRRFIFFDGPITVNARPGVHMTLARIFKDVIPRFKTMQGFYVKRKNGWDTHGLPVELEVEKKLGFKTKKDIEKFGIEKFNEECKRNVQEYLPLFKDITEKIAYWVDMENPYITYDKGYMETLWWIIKQVWDKGLLYQDFKVTPYCPRCGTILSSHEVAQGYKKIKEPAVYLKFREKGEKNTYLLVWTTTPWTLPGNVAVAVNPKFNYVKIKIGTATHPPHPPAKGRAPEFLILAKERLDVLAKKYKIVDEFKGKDLLGKEYQPLFDFTKPDKKAYFIVAGDFVSREEGTGLVHMAPAFGEDDMQVAKRNNLPIILNVDEEGKFTREVKPWAGQNVTDEKLNKEIIEELEKRKLLFLQELYEHDYPFCWRCDSKLIYYAKKNWFIKMAALREKLLYNNREINWIPSHLKEGRFGEWLREVKDWAFSRERYWGTPLPIWQCQKCDYQKCVGSIKELEKLQTTNYKLEDFHRPHIDKVELKCEKCQGTMRRFPQVIDVWFDSGAMPFAQYHYPFENSDLIDKKKQYPAEYIAEAIDQTRGWFYTLLAIATLLGKGTPYKNVLCLGLVLDVKG